MPNRNIYNPVAENVKVQIYGADNDTPAPVNEFGNLIIAITDFPEVSVGNGITIAGFETIAPIEVAAHGITNNIETFVAVQPGNVIRTQGYDVSQLNDFSFFVVADTGDVQTTVYAYPDELTQGFATRASTPTVLALALDGTNYSGVYTANYYTDYSLASLLVSNNPANITVYFQGIY